MATWTWQKSIFYSQGSSKGLQFFRLSRRSSRCFEFSVLATAACSRNNRLSFVSTGAWNVSFFPVQLKVGWSSKKSESKMEESDLPKKTKVTLKELLFGRDIMKWWKSKKAKMLRIVLSSKEQDAHTICRMHLVGAISKVVGITRFTRRSVSKTAEMKTNLTHHD